MATLSVQQVELGTLLEPLSGRPFFIDDPEGVWIVQSGKLDLFLIEAREHSTAGARHPLMRVEAGQAVFGLESLPESKVRVIANPTPNTSMFYLQRGNLQQFVSPEKSLRFLEDWINRLGAVISETAAPSTFKTLQSGEKVRVAKDVSTFTSQDELVWVFHQKGKSRFLGNANLPSVNGEQYFPITKHAWLETDPGAVLDCINSSKLAEIDPEWKGLRAFHRMAMYCLNVKRLREEARERDLLHSRVASDAVLMESGISQLASVLRPGEATANVAEDLVNDPLFRSCQAVGKVQGIKMRAPLDLIHGAARQDPVSAIAKVSGVRLRRVALKKQWWKQDSGPIVAFCESESHPVALLPRGSRAYELYDPVQRQRVLVTPEVALSIQPFGYVFYRPFPPRKLSAFDLLWFGAKGAGKELIAIILMGVATGLLGIAMPYATGVVFDVLIPGAERTQLLQISAFLLISAISVTMFTLTRSYAILRLEGKMDASVQAAVWDRLLGLPITFFRNFNSGDLAMRSLGIVQIRQTLTGSTLNCILSGIFSIFSFALLFYYQWKLALLATGLVILGFLASLFCGYLQVRCQRQIFQLRGYIAGMVLQFISGVTKLRMAGAEGRAFVAWAREFSKQRQLSLKARRVSNVVTVFNAIYPIVALGAIFYYQASLLAEPGNTQLTTGNFLAFLAAFTQFMAAALLLSSSLISVLNIVPLFERAQPILHALPEVAANKTNPGPLTGAIEVSHVRFRYSPSMPVVLRDLSVTIRAGEFVAFVGPSGCGKSTVFRLLLGFETPESGAIYFNGQDLSGLDVQAVRRQMGVVLQTSRLISGDIFTNIVGSSPLTIRDAWEAARMTGIDRDIEQMPMGMHTIISEGGGGISGGQRQRLLLARAIVARPKILLLDEATSALDNHTQAIVSRSLESLRATRVVIAHRLSTIMKADRIFVLEQGLVVQSGSYQELMAQEGLFKELAKRQLT